MRELINRTTGVARGQTRGARTSNLRSAMRARASATGRGG